jgi:hypothetical protein
MKMLGVAQHGHQFFDILHQTVKRHRFGAICVDLPSELSILHHYCNPSRDESLGETFSNYTTDETIAASLITHPQQRLWRYF